MAIDFNKIKARLAELAFEVKEASLNFWDDFKRQTPYFKARAGVITGYILLIALTLVVAPAPTASNPIDAVVKATSLPWGVRNKTVIEIFNDSGDPYENVVVVVEGNEQVQEGQPARAGRWKYTARKLGEGKRMQIEARHLISPTGTHPQLDFAPSGIKVRCSDGVYEDQLTFRNRP